MTLAVGLGHYAYYVYVCMGSLYRSLVAGAHLRNGTGHGTVTFVALLLLTSGLVRYEVVFHHSCGISPVPTCDSVYSWQIYIAGSLGHQAANTMTRYPSLSLIILTTSPCPVLIMLCAEIGSEKYQF